MAEPHKEDIVRVLRVYEFVGPRTMVENQVARSIQGEKTLDCTWGPPNERVYGKMVIKAATIGVYPDILEGEKDG